MSGVRKFAFFLCMTLLFCPLTLNVTHGQSKVKKKIQWYDEQGKLIYVEEDDPRLDPRGRKRWMHLRDQFDGGRRVPGVEVFLKDPLHFKEEQMKFIESLDPHSVLDPNMQEESVSRNVILSWLSKEREFPTAEVDFSVSTSAYSGQEGYWKKLCQDTRKRIKEEPSITPDSLWKESVALVARLKAKPPIKDGYWGIVCNVWPEMTYSKKELRNTIRFQIRYDVEENGFFRKQIASWLDHRVISNDYPGPLSLADPETERPFDEKAEARAMRLASLERFKPEPLPADDGLSQEERESRYGFRISIPQKLPTYHFDSGVGVPMELIGSTGGTNSLLGPLQNAKLTESQLHLLVGYHAKRVRSTIGVDRKLVYQVETDDNLSRLSIRLE